MGIGEGAVKGRNRRKIGNTVLGGLRDKKNSEIAFKIVIEQK
jgi:hypothetical protein